MEKEKRNRREPKVWEFVALLWSDGLDRWIVAYPPTVIVADTIDDARVAAGIELMKNSKIDQDCISEVKVLVRPFCG